METKTVFLKRTENGRYKKVTDISEADYVRVPIQEYIPMSDWNELVDEYDLIKDQYTKMLQLRPGERDDEIIITKEQYNGFQKLLRILRERSRQQINKAVADDHSYTTRFCEERIYDRNHPDQKAFLISKSTPISLNIDLQTATFMIQQDLRDFYSFVDLDAIGLPSHSKKMKISAHDLLLACKQRDDLEYKYDFFVDNSEQGRQLKEWLDSSAKALSFKIDKITSNTGNGVYEVTYWATGPV